VRKKIRERKGTDYRRGKKKRKKKPFPLEKKKGRERDTRRGGGRIQEKQQHAV